MKKPDNYMLNPIFQKIVNCFWCGGTGTIPLNPNNLDDERETECPECEGTKTQEIMQ